MNRDPIGELADPGPEAAALMRASTRFSLACRTWAESNISAYAHDIGWVADADKAIDGEYWAAFEALPQDTARRIEIPILRELDYWRLTGQNDPQGGAR